MPFSHDHTQLLLQLNTITPLSESFQQRLRRHLLTETFVQRTILLRPGEIAKRVYYIKSGFLRGYFTDEDGKEHTTWFVGQGDLMLSVQSFFSQSPSPEYIEVLQDSTLQSINWLELQSYYADFREGNLIGRMFIEKYLILSEQRNHLLRKTAQTKRYQLLLEQYPQIEQLTSLKVIASYLGLRRETLSRIKARLLKKTLFII